MSDLANTNIGWSAAAFVNAKVRWVNEVVLTIFAVTVGHKLHPRAKLSGSAQLLRPAPVTSRWAGFFAFSGV